MRDLMRRTWGHKKGRPTHGVRHASWIGRLEERGSYTLPIAEVSVRLLLGIWPFLRHAGLVTCVVVCCG